mgnify:CR=1 FL=1
MSQNYYNLIVLELLKAPGHIRALAKKLGTNQMTISRKVKELEKSNVVDYRQEGRNNVYFIKKTVEAQEYVLIAEHFKLVRTLQQSPVLRNVIQQIKPNSKIRLALLFGSYASGLAHKDSDIDIYVETTDKNLKKEITQINLKASVKIGRYDPNSILIKEIENNHVVIKCGEAYYEKIGLFL